MTLATFCVTFAFSETFVISSALFIVPPFHPSFPLSLLPTGGQAREEEWGKWLTQMISNIMHPISKKGKTHFLFE
jgi:hypothetical protein